MSISSRVVPGLRWSLAVLAAAMAFSAQAAEPHRRGPMIGMAIESRLQSGEAGEGVRVISVSPGGPAAMAGLQANDIVVSFAGEALHNSPDRSAGEQLITAISAVRVGVPVALEYRRDGKLVKTQVTPVEAADRPRRARPDIPELPEAADLGRRLDDRLIRMGRRNLGGFGAMELTELTPALGRYFGTDKGLLVVRAPSDARLKLEDGDVILDIDGRVPGNAGHALQILRSYRPGESLKLHVMRQRKKIQLALDMPAPPNAAGQAGAPQ